MAIRVAYNPRVCWLRFHHAAHATRSPGLRPNCVFLPRMPRSFFGCRVPNEAIDRCRPRLACEPLFSRSGIPAQYAYDRMLIGRGRRGRSLSRWGHFSRDFVRNPSCHRYNRGVCFHRGSAGSVRGDHPVSWRTLVAATSEDLGRDFSRRLDATTGRFRTDCFGRRRWAP